jgi:preprotein translocase subunit SecY
MLQAFVNCWKIPELRQRLLIALGLLFVARMGACIPLPGLDPQVLENAMKNNGDTSSGVVAMYNLFTGGALLKGAIFALGIMPYISASIIMQLMGAVVPSISRLQQEGDIGRQKIAQYSRYLTVMIAIVQGFMLATAISDPVGAGRVLGFNSTDPSVFTGLLVISRPLFIVLSAALLTAGAIIMTWLGEQMTQRGVGNGTSILITVGILADLPGATKDFITAFGSRAANSNGPQYTWEHALGTVVLGIVVYAAMTAVAQTIRKIPVQYAKKLVGRKMYGGKNSYLPLKLNFAGVMPVIFASAILSFPGMMFQWVAGITGLPIFVDIANVFQRGDSPWYYIIDGLLIFVFSYFWVSLMFKPIQIADDLKKNNGYIPGIRPGDATAKFLDFVMTRLTLAGSVFLVVIAILPDILALKLGFAQRLAYLMGGTGGLIAVGVSLDTMAQIEAILLQRNYEGFLKKGRIGGLNIPMPVRKVTSYGEQKGLGKLGFICITVLTLGIASAIYNYINDLGSPEPTPDVPAATTAPASATTPAGVPAPAGAAGATTPAGAPAGATTPAGAAGAATPAGAPAGVATPAGAAGASATSAPTPIPAGAPVVIPAGSDAAGGVVPPAITPAGPSAPPFLLARPPAAPKPADAAKPDAPAAAPDAKPADVAKPAETPAAPAADAPKPAATDTPKPADKPADAAKPEAPAVAPDAKPADAAKPAETPAAPAADAPKPVATDAPKPVAADAPKPAAAEVVYEVQRGDTLFKIAKAHNITATELSAANNLTDPKITPGQKLKIPAPKSAESPAAPATVEVPATPATPATTEPPTAPAPAAPAATESPAAPAPVAPPAATEAPAAPAAAPAAPAAPAAAPATSATTSSSTSVVAVAAAHTSTSSLSVSVRVRPCQSVSVRA